MTETEMKQYMKEMIQKYDYYDPIKDRTEALDFAKVKNKKILDIGTGKGYLAVLAAKDFRCEVTTIDISAEKIETAKKNAKENAVFDKISFKVADAAALPFSTESFDIAISFNALHHSDGNFKEIISEIFRVSKKKVVITELNKDGARIFDKYIHPEENHRKMMIDIDELKRFLSQFSDVKILERKLMNTYVCNKFKGGKKNE